MHADFIVQLHCHKKVPTFSLCQFLCLRRLDSLAHVTYIAAKESLSVSTKSNFRSCRALNVVLLNYWSAKAKGTKSNPGHSNRISMWAKRKNGLVSCIGCTLKSPRWSKLSPSLQRASSYCQGRNSCAILLQIQIPAPNTEN